MMLLTAPLTELSSDISLRLNYSGQQCEAEKYSQGRMKGAEDLEERSHCPVRGVWNVPGGFGVDRG
jgi:hypothetical protein